MAAKRPQLGNLLAALPPAGPQEAVEVLLENDAIRIERIVSHGHASPANFWYQQQQAEWVCVLSGYGEVSFEDGTHHRLNSSDWLNIPPHARHRVVATDAEQATVWLAVFYNGEANKS
jgi:cupin 2 domain-containing protein